MNLLQRILLLLTDPEGATYDLYNSPQIGDAFLIVSLYAGLSALNSLISAMLMTGTLSVGILAFFSSALIVYLIWAFLSIAFHSAAALLGGKGEIPNAIGFVGLAAAPMVLTTIASLFLTMLSATLVTDDPDSILRKIGFGISIIGMAWGWPGVLCYFGMKNGERIDSLKSVLVTMVMFLGFAAIEVFSSKFWSFE